MTREEYIENIKKLNYYTKLYDEGNPEITDEAWDSLYFDCQLYEQQNNYIDPKSPTNNINYDNKTTLKKVTHNHLMLSLDKTKDIKILRKWLKEPTIVMHKLDGLTCSLTYNNGKLISAETRGNGKIGEDITDNAMRLPSIPKTISIKENIVIDGEVICKYDDFKNFSDIYKNPRNFAAGSIRLLDSNECKKRKLTFIAWDLISSNDDFLIKLDTMKKLGFTVVDYEITDIENLESQQDRLCKLANNHFYPIDGLVYRINDTKSWISKGKTEHHFCGSFAFKIYDQEYETELLNIDWTVGKTGIISPVAVFKPVYIDGVEVKRASMHNISIMEKLLGTNPYIGQKIWVIRANMVIPQIVSERH